MSRRRARGQAMVELALGSLLTISLIFGALYFGELTYIGMKLTEAGTFNAMEATGMRLTSFDKTGSVNQTYGPAKAAVAALKKGSKLNERYEDLDGTSDGQGLVTGWTSTTNVVTQCDVDENFSFRIPKKGQRYKQKTADPYFNDVQDRVRSLYRSVPSDGPMGGFACSARADVTSINIPERMLERDQGGFFTQQHWKNTPLRLCAFGRASNGQCGELGILIGDWAFDGAQGADLNTSVSLRHAKTKSGNMAYWRQVRSIINANGGKDPVSRGDAASKMVEWITWDKSPYDETVYKMSFAGIDNTQKGPYVDHPWGPQGDEYEDVTGGVFDPKRLGTSKPKQDPNRLRVRGSCFLGFGNQSGPCDL